MLLIKSWRQDSWASSLAARPNAQGALVGHQVAFVLCVQTLGLQKALFCSFCPRGNVIQSQEGMLQHFPCRLFLLFTCFLPKVARLGRSEFSSGGDIAESANVLFGTGWQSMIFRLFLFLPAYSLRARDRLVNGCHVEGKSNFHPQVSCCGGQQAPCCLTPNLAVIYCNQEYAALKDPLSTVL